MSSSVAKDESLRELFFRNVNGCKLKLIDKSVKSRSVTKFVLCTTIHVNVNPIFLFTLLILFLWKSFNIIIPFVVSILIFISKLCCILSSTRKETLIVVESVGIYIEGRKVFCSLSSSKFIPWDTIDDVFINEVIKGQRVLYYLTIVVKESVIRRDSIKLIPLFQDLRP